MQSNGTRDSDDESVVMTMGDTIDTTLNNEIHMSNTKSWSFHAPEDDVKKQTEDDAEFQEICGKRLSEVEDLDRFPLMVDPICWGWFPQHCFMEETDVGPTKTEESEKFEQYYRLNRLRRFFEQRSSLYQVVAYAQLVFTLINAITVYYAHDREHESTTLSEGPNLPLNNFDRLRLSVSLWTVNWRSTNVSMHFMCDSAQGDVCMAEVQNSEPWLIYCTLNFLLLQLAYITAPPNWVTQP